MLTIEVGGDGHSETTFQGMERQPVCTVFDGSFHENNKSGSEINDASVTHCVIVYNHLSNFEWIF